MNPLKIMLFGFYGVGEYCDDYMAEATKQTFEEVSEKPIQWVSPSEPADLIILGGGSLLGDNLYLDQLCNILKDQPDCPFAIFGTGVRDTSPGRFIPQLKYLWYRASSISVRGETSRDRLKKWGIDEGKIQVLGDPIFLSRPLELEKQGYIGGVIRPTQNCEWIKGALEFLHTVRNEPVKLFSFCEAQRDGFNNQLSGYESYVLDPAGTRKAIAESSFWFGNRLHAFCLALIEGTPTIGIEIEFDKVHDVCSTLSYPYIISSAGYTFEQAYWQLQRNWFFIHQNVQEKIAGINRNLRDQAQQILELVK